MRRTENWIWLPTAEYPDRQTSYISRVSLPAQREGYKFTVAEFGRTYDFKKKIAKISLRAGGDSAFRLFLCKGAKSVYGPASITGDFIGRNQDVLHAYSTLCEFSSDGCPDLADCFENGSLDFKAEVRMCPEREYELSAGHGGFCLSCTVFFEDGTFAFCGTDGSWSSKLLGAYVLPGVFDMSVADGPEVRAQWVQNVWQSEDSPIPPCTVRAALPHGMEEGKTVKLAGGCTMDSEYEFDTVIAGYVRVENARGNVKLTVMCSEDEEEGSTETCTFLGKGEFQSFGLHSAGKLRVHAENTGNDEAEFRVYLMASFYPVENAAVTQTSDEELNAVLRACENNLKYCRQTLHLDSARHCEPLACTGDYYIETLMTAFSFGDLRLSAFDVRRTAEMMSHRNGRIFHTSYSLIWVQMLYDVYMYTGDVALLSDCVEALTKLLDRFDSYIGETGLIETPPDFMFIDWLNPDGISMHHPPKALGQTCLCMFYFGALNTAQKIYGILGFAAMAERCRARALKLRDCIWNKLWDPQRELFFEGLNTPTPEEKLYRYMPQNVEKRYYRRHANILAAYFGFLPKSDCRVILEHISEDDSLGEVQPYFMHFWLEAIYRNGLRDKYTLELLEKWKESLREFPKGIAEGFYKPEPTYRFDHSHAWGGTPLYALPRAICGFEMLEPGFKKIALNPSDLGLDSASVEIPTPYGKIQVDVKAQGKPIVRVPDGIEYVIPE